MNLAFMSPTKRRVVQLSVLFLGLLLGGAVVAGQVWLSSTVYAAADGTVSRSFLLQVVGGVLQGVGIIGMTVGIAFTLPPASSSARMPGAVRGRNAAGRQIAGAEPYRADEVAQLRRFAEHIVVSSRKSPAHGVKAFGAVLAFVGTSCALPNAFASDDAVIGTVLSVGLVLVVLIMAPQLVYVRRLTRQGVANAEAFLERTQPVVDLAS